MTPEENVRKKELSRGGRNLLLLGVSSIVVALLTTGISLAIYHNSGDIYLDRSRPGFLPDEEEVKEGENEQDKDYTFPKSGALSAEVLQEYLDKLEVEIRVIDAYNKPFNADALSDEKLGIPEAIEEEPQT